MRNILISFSGGRTSAFMAKFCKEYYRNDNLLFVFANTGKEREETLDFVDKCDKEFKLNVVWLEADVQAEKGLGTRYKIVNYSTASREGEPFEEVIKKYGLPSKLYRHCTRELKEVPIHKFAKEYFKGEKYYTALGIRSDEPKRLNYNDPLKIYPLAEINVTEEFIRDWWSKFYFDLMLKDYEGNCDDCFLKSLRKKMTIATECPPRPIWWIRMEKAYGTDRQPMFDVRNNLSYEEISELSKKPFNKAIDKKEQKKYNPSLFDLDIELDVGFDCFCSNT
ncbi:phosphoadenosine phosphosulfate reductase family protein [Chryseobacterium arthrosphaerae]|uniref:Phosphoadenosine phosphosulfate reductase family protein n=1 Tax=Chryseobacterium arthrosphaerae TaxID=651561 RepID=A0ABU7R5Y7_9FLAO